MIYWATKYAKGYSGLSTLSLVAITNMDGCVAMPITGEKTEAHRG